MISVLRLRDYCGITDSDARTDAVLAGLEARAVALLSTETGCYWGGAEDDHVYMLDGGGSASLWLPDFGATINEVAVRESMIGEFYALDATYYEVNGRQILRTDGGIFPVGTATVRVTANRGYALDAAPLDVQQAVLDYVNFMFRPGRTGVLSGDMVTDYRVIPNWKRVIELYRVPLYA